jgi:hypothetical protein
LILRIRRKKNAGEEDPRRQREAPPALEESQSSPPAGTATLLGLSACEARSVQRIVAGLTSAPEESQDEGYQEQDEENEEQDARDLDRADSDASETEQRGDESDDEKYDGVAQHNGLPCERLPWRRARSMRAVAAAVLYGCRARPACSRTQSACQVPELAWLRTGGATHTARVGRDCNRGKDYKDGSACAGEVFIRRRMTVPAARSAAAREGR